MPRHARLDAPGALHHVIGRSIPGVKLFQMEADCEDFLTRLADLCKEGGIQVYAWALMPNHFHLLLQTGRQALAASMRKLLTGFAVNFNRRHKRYGHLLQNRYKSIVCEEEPYLLELTRYIHLNPLRAGLVEDLAGLRDYPWSGHAVLMGRKLREWQNTGTILGLFDKRRKVAIGRYEAFVREGVPHGRRSELVGGGLVRSAGGWSQVLAFRRKGNKMVADERILGGGEFAETILAEATERTRQTLRLPRTVAELGMLARRVASREGVTETELRSGSRRQRASKARRSFCRAAVTELGISGAEVARFLGVTTSAVNRVAGTESKFVVKR
jgi:REP element-mobilizing transposase RayT